jgi:hypothetical protein
MRRPKLLGNFGSERMFGEWFNAEKLADNAHGFHTPSQKPLVPRQNVARDLIKLE